MAKRLAALAFLALVVYLGIAQLAPPPALPESAPAGPAATSSPANAR